MLHDIIRGNDVGMPRETYPDGAKESVRSRGMVSINEIALSSKTGFFDFPFSFDFASPSDFADNPHKRNGDNIIKELLENPINRAPDKEFLFLWKRDVFEFASGKILIQRIGIDDGSLYLHIFFFLAVSSTKSTIFFMQVSKSNCLQ